ncbi:hypothetical protein J437_LFUL003020 [Ladona fulva]|uniref:Ionotropic glutamate receptor L-glutamate and glycine-binding domain-containing protein n=1 Tax=Ladona fulva TaxID=123851 RepID=A0A8K0JU78_LADFU|nr:hypothetical protein J437_LFUL003020 [Ladona fulva]
MERLMLIFLLSHSVKSVNEFNFSITDLENSTESPSEVSNDDTRSNGENVPAMKRKDQRDPIYIDSLRWVVSDILNQMLNPFSDFEARAIPKFRNLRCAAIFGDSTHAELLGFNFGPIKTIRDMVPTINYRVKETEELKNPGNETLTVLRTMVKDGCRIFVILLKDGNLVGNFLRFGDRNRELDTRANFILLYDSHLFHPEFQYIWKKIVNVIFLRPHLHSTPWFEILTVPFPFFDNKTKLVDIWSRGVFRISSSTIFRDRLKSDSNLFPEKTKDLQGISLAVFTFDHVPSAIKKEDSFVENLTSTFQGIEIKILETLAKFMNFRVQLMEVGNDERWGSKDKHGNWSGLIGAVSRGEVDIALGNLFYSPCYQEKFDLTIPYTVQCLTFLTPESRADNSWLTLILPFKGPTWGAIISTLIVGGFLFRFMASIKVSHPRRRQWRITRKSAYPFANLDDAILYSWGMLLQVPPPTLPLSWPLRFLSGCWWIFCLLAAVAYRSSMTAVLSSPPPRLVYDTLSDLAASGVSSGGWGDQPKEFFSTALDLPSRRIAKHFEALEGPQTSPQNVADRVASGKFAYYENEYWLRDARAKYLRGDKRNGSRVGPYGLHVMRECAIKMPISVGLRDNSPLKERIDHLLQRVVEAGLISKWQVDAMKPTLMAELKQLSVDDGDENVNVGTQGDSEGEDKKALMNLRKMSGAFFALGVGSVEILSGLCFKDIFYSGFVKGRNTRINI